jgi:hypothetical protein
LYGQVFVREPQGRGAHFDVYDKFLDPQFPWVALFNLAGDATVSTIRLPDELAKHYALTHPEASDEAYTERRRLAKEALEQPNVHPEEGLLLAGNGLVIPQQSSGPEWVHHIVPMLPQCPGRFVKFLVSRYQADTHLLDRGYVPVNSLLRRALLALPVEDSGDAEIRPRRRCNLD